MFDFSAKILLNVFIFLCAVDLLSAQKPGNCPRNPIDIGETCTANCGGDESCPGEEKCCSHGCSTECTAPVFDQTDKGRDPICSPNQQWTECGTSCPETCEGTPKACEEVCVIGCQCRPGFVRHETECIPKSQCPVGANEEAHPCLSNQEFVACGTPCPETCAGKPKNCVEVCTPQCQCRPGFVLHIGDCIPKDQCPHEKSNRHKVDPPHCHENQEWQACGPSCPETCPGQPTPANCSLQCVPGCQCVPGFVLDNGKCVPKHQCKSSQSHVAHRCGHNEEYEECGTACVETCEERPTRCTKQCMAGCQCKAGYVRNAFGSCIAREQCPKLCPDPNQERRKCALGCDCEEYVQRQGQCSEICAGEIGPNGEAPCFCREGYIVDGRTGRCISLEQCVALGQPAIPTPCKDPNEEHSDCGNCDKTCDNRNLNVACPTVCKPGCFCKSGFIRSPDGRCILEKDCPKAAGNKEQICRMQKVAGPCQGAIPGYWFNAETNHCEQFLYGGCLGNENRFNTEDECLKFCVGSKRCPNDQPEVQCFADPCRTARCPAFPNAKCVSNFCGGCNAKFFDSRGNEVTGKCNIDASHDDQCATVRCGFCTECQIVNGSTQCVPAKNNPDCHRAPPPSASSQTCANFHCANGTACQDTPKGPICNPASEKPGTCPIFSGRIGICIKQCNTDADCPDAKKCCSTGCGASCKDPDHDRNIIPITCDHNPCGECEKCIPIRIVCIKDPCHQFRCEATPNCTKEEENEKTEIAKGGDCPTPRNPASPGDRSCPNECREDSDCEGRKKCCANANGCGRKCISPRRLRNKRKMIA